MYDPAASQRHWKQQELRDMSKLSGQALFIQMLNILLKFSQQPLFNLSLQTNEDGSARKLVELIIFHQELANHFRVFVFFYNLTEK